MGAEAEVEVEVEEGEEEEMHGAGWIRDMDPSVLRRRPTNACRRRAGVCRGAAGSRWVVGRR